MREIFSLSIHLLIRLKRCVLRGIPLSCVRIDCITISFTFVYFLWLTCTPTSLSRWDERCCLNGTETWTWKGDTNPHKILRTSKKLISWECPSSLEFSYPFIIRVSIILLSCLLFLWIWWYRFLLVLLLFFQSHHSISLVHLVFLCSHSTCSSVSSFDRSVCLTSCILTFPSSLLISSWSRTESHDTSLETFLSCIPYPYKSDVYPSPPFDDDMSRVETETLLGCFTGYFSLHSLFDSFISSRHLDSISNWNYRQHATHGPRDVFI